jgi:uncharacterized protein
VAPICLALAFAGGVLLAVECTPIRAQLRFFTAIGRMAFSDYVAQSLLFGFIFFGYGLAQFGKLRAVPVFGAGVLVYVAQTTLSHYWLRHYQFGPIEWLWRTLTYGARQPMRRNAGRANPQKGSLASE